MRRRNFPVTLSALALGALHRVAGAQPSPAAPAGSAPEYPAFEAIRGKIQAEYPDVESVVVVRRGQVLFEHYIASPDTLRDVQSVTKSVLSLAVGAAIGRGALASLDQPIGELLGRAETSSSSPLTTIRHLLTMTAGFRTQERFEPGTADDPDFLLRRERVELPGKAFAYDNLGANLLSIALEAATGQNTSTFADEVIFRPLGINAFDWTKGAKGHSLGFSGLRLRTRDMAKLGELALNGGTWGGKQVVPEIYAREAVAPHSSGGRPVGLSYGYMWWVVPSTSERRTFLASGWGGQFIWAHPPLDLVISTTSRVSADANRRAQALSLIRTELFRAAAATRV